MSYFDSKLARRLTNALTDVGVPSNDYLGLIQIYYAIHVLRKHLQEESEVTAVTFNALLNADPILLDLATLGVRLFSPAQSATLYTIYNLVCENGLHRDYVRFFRLLAPAMVADWEGISQCFTDEYTREDMLRILYYISEHIYRVSGSKAVFGVNPDKVTEDILNAEALEDYPHVLLKKCVTHALYITLDPLARQPKEKYVKALRDVINKVDVLCNEDGNITARECILQFLTTERLTSNEMLNRCLKRLQKLPPSDVIRQFKPYTQNDDILILRFVLARFFEMSSTGELLIYNPSPTMLTEYPNFGGVLEKTIFVVSDALETQAYQREFSKYMIYSADTLPEVRQSNILILDADGNGDKEQIRHLLKRAASPNMRFLMYTTQTAMTSISQFMETDSFYIDAILGLPTGISQSEPAKKALLFGSAEYSEVVRIMLAERNVQTGRGKTGLPYLPVNALYLSRQYFEIPRQWLQRNMTISQMISMKTDADFDSHGKYQSALSFKWSQEITVFYSVYPRENGYFEGRAHLKTVSMKKGKLRYGTRVGELMTRGLRGRSVDGILDKLPTILFEQELYNQYLPILEELYNESPEGLSLKTVWYMLWGDLQLKISYDDSVCRELFCGECQALSNINPATATADSIFEALSAVCGLREIPDTYVKQLCLIFKIATDRKFFVENKLKDVIARIRTQKSELENLMARMRKRTVTDVQVKRILAVLMEMDGSYPRYASSSKYFFMAITLFSPVSLVHLRALKWADIKLTSDLCVIKISKKMTRDGREIAVCSPFDVPCSPIVAMICQERLRYLESIVGISSQMMENQPIFWACDPSSESELKHKQVPISHATAKMIQREMITIAGVQEASTQITDGKQSQMINLNNINLRTFWYDNVVTHAAVRGLERGETSYLLGKVPVDTVDAHYYGFSAPYNLARMAAIQHRWTAPYEALLKPALESHCGGEYHLTKGEWTSSYDAGKSSFLYVEICPDGPEGEVRIEIDSQFGHYGMITQVD